MACSKHPSGSCGRLETFKDGLCSNTIFWKGLYVPYILCYCHERLNEEACYQLKCLWKLNPCLNEFKFFNVKFSS